MKLKTILLSGIFLIPLFSCENNEEFTTQSIGIEIITDIPVIYSKATQSDLKSDLTQSQFTFSGSGFFTPLQSAGVMEPNSVIRNIKPEQNFKLIFPDLTQEINIMTMYMVCYIKSFDDSDFKLLKQVEISPLLEKTNNSSFEIELTKLTDLLGGYINDNPNCQFRVDVSGTADTGLSSPLKLAMWITADKCIYSTGFSLF